MAGSSVPPVAATAPGAISVEAATQHVKNPNWSVNPEVPHVSTYEALAHDSGLPDAVQLCAARPVDDAPISPATPTLGQDRTAYYRYLAAGHGTDSRRPAALQPRRPPMADGQNHCTGGVYHSRGGGLSSFQP